MNIHYCKKKHYSQHKNKHWQKFNISVNTFLKYKIIILIIILIITFIEY